MPRSDARSIHAQTASDRGGTVVVAVGPSHQDQEPHNNGPVGRILLESQHAGGNGLVWGSGTSFNIVTAIYHASGKSTLAMSNINVKARDSRLDHYHRRCTVHRCEIAQCAGSTLYRASRRPPPTLEGEQDTGYRIQDTGHKTLEVRLPERRPAINPQDAVAEICCSVASPAPVCHRDSPSAP
ncbi:hypothetical protein K431DRAFT_19988 [Polychaeton citri CBS 116435]|uniref:Uncharacterized protein n=1 Tax=Polychaeton citri CBS 116435 TaxID=1314669 RepID=A0A9P4UKY1_9PEZI|nr:hypothetical protein K431DRAFT_19988 [Polychaeton citri CBS 116435]